MALTFRSTASACRRRAAFRVKNLDIAASPTFKYRALLPWDNFLCGMSGWNLEQYTDFIDRAARMKFNMLQFHFYPTLAFFTETWNGKPVDPKFLGSPVDTFKTKGSIGESVFGGIEIFGSKPYVDNLGKPRAQAEACQEMMRRRYRPCPHPRIQDVRGIRAYESDRRRLQHGRKNQGC